LLEVIEVFLEELESGLLLSAGLLDGGGDHLGLRADSERQVRLGLGFAGLRLINFGL
jgi:hypothetical protein